MTADAVLRMDYEEDIGFCNMCIYYAMMAIMQW